MADNSLPPIPQDDYNHWLGDTFAAFAQSKAKALSLVSDSYKIAQSIPQQAAQVAQSAAGAASQAVDWGSDRIGQGIAAAPQDLVNTARQAAINNGIDPRIFGRQIFQESGFDPNAHNPSGASGIAQFMPGTAQGLGINPLDPTQALNGAAGYMKNLLDHYGGDYRKALAAYNAGEGNVDKYGGVPPFAETQTYLANILGDSGQPQASAQQYRSPVSTATDAARSAVGGAGSSFAGFASSLASGIQQRVADAFAPIQQAHDQAQAQTDQTTQSELSNKYGFGPYTTGETQQQQLSDLAHQTAYGPSNFMQGAANVLTGARDYLPELLSPELSSSDAYLQEMRKWNPDVTPQQAEASRQQRIANTYPNGLPPPLPSSPISAIGALAERGQQTTASEPRVQQFAEGLANPAYFAVPEAVGRGLGQTIESVAGAAGDAARALPSVKVEPPEAVGQSQRFYHGSPVPFQAPDAARFSTDGLRGPAYYMTDSPTVASSYSQSKLINRINPLPPEEGGPILENLASQVAAMPFKGADVAANWIREDAKGNIPLSESLLSQIGSYVDDPQYKAAVSDLTNGLRGSGANVRAIDVPNAVNLLDGTRGVGADGLDAILAAAAKRGISADAFASGVRNGTVGPNIGGDTVWTALQSAAKRIGASEPGRLTNEILSDAGYDGVRYDGGKRIPMNDANGNPIEHNAVAIFPQSMGKIRNALSGTAFGGGLGTAIPQQPGESDEAYRRRLQVAQGIAGIGIVGSVASSRNPATQEIFDMIDRPPGPPESRIGAIESARQDFVRAWTDNRVDLVDAQARAAKAAGRVLGPTEMAAELSRRNPDLMAQVNVQRNFLPALQTVGEADQKWLSAYLIHNSNVDQAAAIGERVKNAELAQPLPKTPGEQQINQIKSRIVMYKRFRDQGAAAGDGTVVTHYDQLLADAQKDLNNAGKTALRQVTAADAKRTLSAKQAGSEAQANRQFSGGLNADTSAQALQDMPSEIGPERFRRVQQAAQMVWKFNQDLLQKKLDAGLITPALYDRLTTIYPHYVPTEITDFLLDPNNIPTGRSLSVNDNEIRHLSVEGTGRDREDPLNSTLRNAYETQALVNRNETFNAVVNLRGLDPGLSKVIRPVGSNFSETRDELPLTGFVNGVKTKFAVPRDLEYLIRSTATSPVPGLNQAMSIFRALVASRDPLFIPMHAKITVYPYIVRTLTREGGPTPQNLVRVVGALVPAYADAFRGLLQRQYHGDTARFIEQGGGTFGGFDSSVHGTRQTLQGLTRTNPLQVRNKADLLRIIKDGVTLQPVEDIINRVDLAPRVAAFKLAERRGLNSVAAMNEGRTATIDFQVGGNTSRYLNQVIPFFNVGTQAGAQIGRAYRDNPKAFLATAIATLATPTALFEAWNRSDPQRAKDYADVPQYIKDRGLVFMLPGPAPVDKDGNRRPQFIPIETREFSPFVMATREILGRALGDNPRDWADLIGHGLASQLPIQGSSAADVFGAPLPIGLKQGLELSVNKDFYRNTAIVSKRRDQEASPLAKGLASGINTVTGALGRPADVKPSQTSYLLQNLGGGPGQMAESLSSIGQPPTGSNVPQDKPVVGPIIGRFVRGSTGNLLNVARQNTLSAPARQILEQGGIGDMQVAQVGSAIHNIPLNIAEEQQYQTLANKYVEDYLRMVSGTPTWQKESPAVRRLVAKNAIDAARQKAANQTLAGIPKPELRQKVEAVNKGVK